ncbi:hypothetical protein [Streptomyces corynorhini]|uniref:Phage tail assembly protein n=1 Tax=Streptomyces corynorhini TaxID=2282652 RepID=A0A370B2N3_9ACTN|nr:hypothetical protein [Streptomyces corynorhini]RDG36127.1 hypothetical protein DVH02_21650 [Streptomyces corynorhini]
MRRALSSSPPSSAPPAPEGRADGGAGSSPRESLRTEFAFELPRGYVDDSGTVHRSGVMRLATARDELVPLRDDRVRENSAYLSVVLIARVVSRIGTVDDVHPGVIEDLFASDLAFLQDFYRRVNSEGHTRAAVTCPSCQESFAVDLAGGGGGGRPGES